MDDDLDVGLDYHQRGNLQQAARVYQNILARDPGHADALHLLGVLHHQAGDQRRAVELISRAVGVKPAAAPFHCNLAEAYRAQGDFERAAECCRTALRLDPRCAEAANNLGLALLGQKQAAAAAAQFRAALRVKPDFSRAYNNLGNALLAQGEKHQAAEHFRAALRLDAGQAGPHSNLGQLLLEWGELDEALAHCRQAVRLDPKLAEAHSNLGTVFRELGKPAEAKGCYAEALRLNRNLAAAHNNMGQAIQEEGKPQEALTWYRQALQLEPSSARFHATLASALEEMGQHDEAVAEYETALGLDPSCAEAHNGLGLVRHDQGRYEEAQAQYRQALRLKPDLTAAHCNLGTLLEELNDFDGALTSVREALQRDPRHAGAHGQQATLLRGKLPEADVAAMKQLLADPLLAPAKRSALHFGLAHVLDAQGDYEAAAWHLREANALSLARMRQRGQGYDPAAHSAFVDGLVAGFTEDFFARVSGFGVDSDRPILIFGMPRSGTTLTEQILASHSQVFGAGELPYFREAYRGLPAAATPEVGSQQPRSAVSACLGLDRATVRSLAQAHLARLDRLTGSAGRVADKMPDNYLYLGLAAALFPNAKLIHCRRDLRDVAVSCWMTNFRQIRWACDLDHIAARCRDYQRLMDHWHAVLPVPILEVDYEETVADLESVARRLVAWCGLEWEPGCLAFHESRRPVRTASVRQVRQPVYRTSVARWKNYAKDLGPLFAKLQSVSCCFQEERCPP